MKNIFLFLISIVTLYANIGTVVDSVGESNLLRNGQKIKVVQKLQLKEHDTIKTGDGAKVKIFFKDQTAVSLGQNTTFNIDSYFFDNTKKSNIKFKVLKGFFKTVTGKISKIAPNRFKLQTKNATIGIRGTVFAAEVGDDTDVVMCTDGRIILFTPNGDIEIERGREGIVKGGGRPEIKSYTEKEKLRLIKSAGWHGSMSLEELKEFIKKNFKEPLRSELLATVENIYNKDSSEQKKSKIVTENADDIGYVDDITINGREFDELPKEIEFYPEDLKNGKVIVEGLLESDDKNVPVDSLNVEITTDGGESWSRAKGHGEWSWDFEPELGREYAFSLRVVRDKKTDDDSSVKPPSGEEEENDLNINYSNSFMIAGFKLYIDANANLTNGKLSGSGQLEIPYLDKISGLPTKIDVNFQNLSVSGNDITLGDIEYSNPFVISTPLADLEVSKLIISATPANNKIEGKIVFKGELSATFDDIVLGNAGKLLPDGFNINIPFSSKTINIWAEKGVLLYIPSGSLKLSYALEDALPKADFDIPNALFKFGDLLKYVTTGLEAQVGLENFGKTPTITLPQDCYLLDTGIKMPSGLSLSFDLSDYSAPKFSFNSPVDLSGFSSDFVSELQNTTIEASVNKSGMSATISAEGSFDPVTILDRGTPDKSVRLLFEGESPSITLNVQTGQTPQISFSGITPKISFGELFTDINGVSLSKTVSLGSIKTPSLDIQESLYLLGSKIKLPDGFSASVDLSDLKNPIFSFDVNVDFSSYDNFIAKHIAGAKIAGTLSKNGFISSLTASTPSPIDIYQPKNVKLVFNGDLFCSVSITSTDSLPDFEIDSIDADLDFGTLLKDMDKNSVVATLTTLADSSDLVLTLPSKVKFLSSKLNLEGLSSTLNIKNKNISLGGVVDLSEYGDNPLLNAISGANFSISVTPTSFSGNIEVEDELEPIDIWAEKGVVLNIAGNPTLEFSINGDGVDFDFGNLNASVDFGDLLLDSARQSITAALTKATSGKYSVSLQNEAFLLGSEFALPGLNVEFDPNAKSLSLSGNVNLSNYSEPFVKAFNGASFSATVSTDGFSGTLSKEGGFEPMVVLDRGGEGKDVSVEFTSSPTVSLSIKNSGLDFGFSGGSAKVNFGDFLGGAVADLASLQDGVYSWAIDGKNKLFSASKAYVENITNASIDIRDFKNPKISFNADVDLSQYGGLLSSVHKAVLKNVEISKNGFKGSLSASLGNINIWKEKRVTMSFVSDPTLSLSVTKEGFDIGVSKLNAKINFGDLLNEAVADIGDVMQAGEDLSSKIGTSSAESATENVKEQVEEEIVSRDFSWSITGTDLPLMGSNIKLSEIGGSLDLSDIYNPKITFNAIADLSNYSEIFQYVKSAQLDEVSISKSGFEGSLILSMNEINIWKEKNVKIIFDSTPSFYLRANNEGLKVGAKDISASVHLGDLLNNSTALLKTLEDDMYSWNIDGKNQLGSTSVYLSDFAGKIDFKDLKDPVLYIDSATFEGLSDKFRDVTLKNAKISKKGFDAYVSAGLDDINLYAEDNKKIDLRFKENKTPTLHLALGVDGYKIGLSDIEASLVFTNLLNDSTISLNSLVEDGVSVEGVYKWNLDGEYIFVNDSRGEISVRNIGGSLDLSDWKDPVAVFHTVADFSNYNLPGGLNLGIADVERAEIKKDEIKWNVSVQNARANFTILDLGEGPNDDVRVELKNISASADSSGSASVSGGDGTLYLGKLFSGNKQASLSMSTDSNGLKKYSFSFSEDLVYKQDDNNFITLKTPSGEVDETSDGKYKVILTGEVEAHSSLLNAISIERLNATNLEISSSGFKGGLSATFSNLSKSLLNGKVTLSLKSLEFNIDTSKSVPIELETFNGDLELGEFFDEESAKAAISLLSEGVSVPTLKWEFPADTTLHVKKFLFKNLNGSLDLSSLSSLELSLSGKFEYENSGEEIDLQDFKINTDGISGSVSWSGNKAIVDSLYLKALAITFAGVNTSGTIGIKYKDDSFLDTGTPVDIGLSATVDKDGIDSFSVDGNLQSINISNFAKFNFTSLSASPSFSDFWVSLDGNVKPQNALFGSDTELAFKGLKISGSGISVESANAEIDVSGASASLGSLTLSINKLGLGFDSTKGLFFIKANGGIALDIIGDAAAGVTLYSNKTINVDDIAVNIHQSGLVASGSIAWFDNDTIYGNGFKATLGMKIAEIFSANGLFRIGQKDTVFYWMAKASVGGAEIPLNPIPLSIYEIGGGIAYHMKYNETQKDFVPDASNTALILSSVLGTSGDGGYLWNGDISITASINNGTLGQLRLDGISWILANRGEHPPKRKIEAHMTLSSSAFHLWINANVEYKSIKVNGKMDTMFSSSEKHVFIGSDEAYAYAFAGYTELGHVNVTAFGISGYGFFMVDSNAIAFGEGIKLNKHWSKDWVGPDPSLDFKLNAGAKALFIYKPFQMNIDLYAEVALKACYGGCLSVGADVQAKFATPNPYYIWGKAGVEIFGEHISFSGCIDGNCDDLQESSPKPDFVIFDKVEVPMSGDGASLLPYMKIVSKIPKAQNLVDIRLESVILKKKSGGFFSSLVPLECGPLDSDFKGQACMPKNRLKRNKEYKLIGKMVATYEENGETETTEKIFSKTFRTTSQNIISFDEIVKRITPADKDENVHEDSGVVVEYNQKVVSKLGINSNLVRDYEIELYDSDNNRIRGTFTPPNANYKAKFKPARDLRVYRYCKNEEGKIRETFVLNGEYLNPFNGFKVDNGDSNIPVASEIISSSGPTQNTPSQQGIGDVQKILNAVAQTSVNSSGGSNNQGANTAILQNGNLTPQEVELAKIIPPNLRLGDIVLNDPQALGEFVKSSYNSGKSYSYYRASKYQIIVRHKPTNKVVHNSTFRIRYNNIPAEAKRKVEQMGDNLDPSLTVRFDENRLGGGNGVYMVDRSVKSGNYNGGYFNEVRLTADDSLLDIGVTSSIISKVTVLFTIHTKKGGTREIKKSWINRGQEVDFFLPGIITEYSGIIEYYTDNMGQPGDKLLTKELRLISGEPFNAVAEQEAREEAQAAMDEARNEFQQSADRVDTGGGGTQGLSLGGFGQVGGGFNPNDEMGAFENMDVSIKGGAAIHGGAFNTGAAGTGAHIVVDVGR